MQIDSYDSPEAQSLIDTGVARLTRRRRPRRVIVTDLTGAAGFLGAAVALAAIAPWHRLLQPSSVALVLLAWVLIERVRFPVASGWSYPTMLAFVPALFVLPTPVVPLVSMVAVVLRGVPEMAARRVSPTMIPAFIGDAWFSIGPALVIVLAGDDIFRWQHWPVYALALLVQMVFDAAANTSWSWIGERIDPRVQLPLLGWIYLMDAALAPLGLVIAAVAVDRPVLVLFSLSPVAMLLAFSHERRERLEQTRALSTAYRGTAMLLGDVVEANDYYTGVHSRDVVDLALGVADVLGLDPSTRRNVEFAALLHDIGKIRVPREIINKPGALDASEWAIVSRHTIEGEMMLKQVGGMLSSIGSLVRSSHERYDGRGYPDGLCGEQIPIESRIVAACDAFSAMTTDRAYRQAMSVPEAGRELRRCAGTQFDSSVVQALQQIVRVRPSCAAERDDGQPAPSEGGISLRLGGSFAEAGTSAR